MRIAVTGMGTINPLGHNKDDYINNLKEMKNGITSITQFDTTDFKAKIAAEVKDLDPTRYLDRKKAKRYDRVLQLALISTAEAIADAKLDFNEFYKENTAVIVGSGIGGFKTLSQEFQNLLNKGPRQVSPFLIPMMIPDMASGVISMEYGLTGPNFATVSACASSLHSIIVGSMMIRHGYAKAAIVGGTDASITPLAVAAFANMTALSTRNNEPEKASRPFDQNRDGFVMAEGSGILVLEAEEEAKKRGANIYGYIDGFASSGDAYHLSQSDPAGKGAAIAIKKAMAMAQLQGEDIDLVSAHATSTPIGDISETLALRQVLKESVTKPVIQATKALIGHALGAAGVIELIGAIMQLHAGFVHGMPNLENPDQQFGDLFIPKATMDFKGKTILKNSFGFGGHNASLIFNKED